MPQGVTADIQNLERSFSQRDLITTSHRLIQRRETPDLLGTNNHTARFVFQALIAASVVGMPVRIEDEIQPPPPAGLKISEDRVGVRRIDGGDLAGRFVANEKAIVIAKARELADQ